MIVRRNRIKQTESLEARCAKEGRRLREQAKSLPPSMLRSELLRKAREAETASHLIEWLRSPGLRAPT